MGLIKCPGCDCTISDHMDVCPGCGYRPEGRNFYPGKPKSTAIPVRCPWCGKMVPAGQKSCPACGSPAKISYSMAPRRLMPVALDDAPSRDEDGKSESRGFRWLLFLLAALLFLVIVWSAMTLRRPSAPPEPALVMETDKAVAQDVKTTRESADALSRVFSYHEPPPTVKLSFHGTLMTDAAI